MHRFPLSAMLTSLPLPFEESLQHAVSLGFDRVDVVALIERPAQHYEALAESGVVVSCAVLGRNLPEGHTLDAVSLEVRRATVDLIQRQIADAAKLGATHAYLIPGIDPDPEALARFTEGCALLAQYASQRMVRFCVEHFPYRALPSAVGTLEWLQKPGLEKIHLLLDVGHCLISNEDPGAVARLAGERLGYVHLDDNDGVSDLHWALLTGRLSRQTLADCLRALHEMKYSGVLAFEFHPQLEAPLEALAEGKQLLEELMST